MKSNDLGTIDTEKSFSLIPFTQNDKGAIQDRPSISTLKHYPSHQETQQKAHYANRNKFQWITHIFGTHNLFDRSGRRLNGFFHHNDLLNHNGFLHDTVHLLHHSDSLLKGHNYVTGTKDTEDRINHGTAVASVILGCESAGIEAQTDDIPVVPLVITDKVDGEVTSVSPDVLAQAIRDSVDKYGACIINVSLGIKKDDAAVKEAVAYVQKQGALVICAAGNDGDSEELYYPAAYDGVLTVGSHDKDLKVSSFTQQNGTVDILAPGEDIWLASRNGKTYGAKGTSYATGYVSATAALLWQTDLTQTSEEIVQTILSSAQTADGWKILTRQE